MISDYSIHLHIAGTQPMTDRIDNDSDTQEFRLAYTQRIHLSKRMLTSFSRGIMRDAFSVGLRQAQFLDQASTNMDVVCASI